MDASIISEVVLPVVFVAVGATLIWALVELVKFMRNASSKVDAMEAQLTPILKDVRDITESIKPAADKVDPLVERVSLAVDAANLEIMRIDGILENVDGIAESAANAVDAVDTVANSPLRLVNAATEKLREAFSPRKVSEESAALADAAEGGAAKSIREASAEASDSPSVEQGVEDAAPQDDKPGFEFRVDVESCASEKNEDAAKEKYFTYGTEQNR